MDEVKLLPCEELVESVKQSLEDVFYDTLDCAFDANLLARAAIEAYEATRPTTLVTDEVVERVARAIDPKAWAAFDDYAEAKRWSPEEIARETAEHVGLSVSLLSQSFDRARAAIAAMPAIPPQSLDGVFQDRVDKWMDACFTPTIKADVQERCDRFIEEALEFIQATGYPASRAHALVDYTFGRPLGEINQEVGGVMVTLAAMCNTLSVDIGAAAETELARVWTKIDAIRAKQAAKPTGSTLPIAETPTPGPAIDQDGGEA